MYGWLVPKIIFPLYERTSGRRFWTQARRLRELQWRDPEELERRAANKLAPLLAHAARNVPYYRDLFKKAGVSPGDIRSAADLTAIPASTKADLRANFPERTTAANLPAERRWKARTSGSSGLPFEFYRDRAEEDVRIGSYLFFIQWAGVAIWEPRILISSRQSLVSQISRSSWRGKLARRFLIGAKTRSLSGSDLTVSELDAIVRQFSRGRNYLIWSSGSYAARLARNLLETGLELSRYPKALVSTADTLTEANALTIHEAFRTRAVNHYSCYEVAYIAQSCPDHTSNLHINSERAILRVVREDGQPAAPGEPGYVVLTSLSNYVMPLINYRVGDRAVVGEPCPCGRGLPTLTSLEGREAEMIHLPSGRSISPGTIGNYLLLNCDAIPYIWEYQAVQTAQSRVLLRVVPTGRFNRAFAGRLVRSLEDLFNHEASVIVEPVDEIPAEPSGKRLIIKTQPAAATGPGPRP